MPRYVIIGNSAGGIGAAEAIREIDYAGSILIISDEPYPAYSRPLISEYLAGEKTLDQMLYRPRDFYGKNGIETAFGRRVVGIDVASRAVILEDGGRVDYEKLLIATGGVPFVPKIEGSDKRGVFTFTRLQDAQNILDGLGGCKRAVVIGGGLIGISVTEALAKRGVSVTVIELKDRILNVILDEQASQMAEAVVRKAGISIKTNCTVKEILGRDDGGQAVGGVVLDNGERIDCEIVIVAIGVVPRLDAIRNSGIRCNRGIVVDRHMMTDIADVYACGDVAEAYDYVLGTNRLTPIWPNAYIGGRVAGFNMAGKSVEYPGGTAMNSLKYFGLAIASGGLVSADSQPGCEVITSSRLDSGVYRKVILRDGAVVGFTFVGEIESAGIVCGLMRDRINVSAFKEALVADDFDFASLPKELRKQRLGLGKEPLEFAEVEDLAEELVLE